MPFSRLIYEEVRSLFNTGLSDRAIARQTGVPPGTVSRWHRADTVPSTVLRSTLDEQWLIADPRRYCYLLGAYLGDGTVCHQPPGFWELRIINDRRYRAVSAEILDAMRATFPGGSTGMWPASGEEADILHVAHPAIPRAFPQRGPGRKHQRRIGLTDWQLELTHAHPDALVRGLIHSDGCRCINSFKTKLPSGRVAGYSYVRYFFTNHSADIRDIFAEHCGLLGVRVTQPNHRNLAVSHRKGVAILERLIGPKG
ncbi:MAG: hypothetical protein WAK93_16450 [Solirubrobacteraceae bacterium]